jgi:hypothetical protein
MDEIKITNFAAAHPGAHLPTFRHLERDECGSLQTALAAKLGLPVDSPGLAILRALESRANDIPSIQPSEDSFDLSDLFKRLQLEAKKIYINWSRFDDIDEMNADEFSSFFHDLWYPASDDIEIFDDGQRWVLLIRHFDIAQIVRIKDERTNMRTAMTSGGQEEREVKWRFEG